ncbi:hypothetical protein E4U21_000036 [Claviceps maximensis]|nr:hypothetical protein E4U21_000036 [Claviceps maximensis]
MMEQQPITASFGQSLPPDNLHAISVSLPTWQDSVGWAKRDPSVLARLQTGYPRCFIHYLVDRLATRLLQWVMRKSDEWDLPCSETPRGGQGERPALLAMVFPHVRLGWSCVEYLDGLEPNRSSREAAIFAFQVSIMGQIDLVSSRDASSTLNSSQSLCVVVYPERLSKEAKGFWQHTGFGISSRHAVYWSAHARFLSHESDLNVDINNDGQQLSVPPCPSDAKDVKDAIQDIRCRVAGMLSSPEGVVSAEDTFLYPTGMSAIAHSAIALRQMNWGSSEPFRVAVFGFVYVDTFKVLSKVMKFECKLYGHADMDQLERDLGDGGMRIHALYMEFPGNPLLQSTDLNRLRDLSRKFDFYLVIDDTLSTSVNLILSPFCDLICTSLSKMFSGGGNVMGGSVTVAPYCRHRVAVHAVLRYQHLDTYFSHDILVMRMNSVNFASRVAASNRNAEALADRLRKHPTVDEVFYPRGSATQHLYERHMRTRREAGYGHLLSVRFVKPAAAIAFYDALELAKGPSLGTNFSLCCAYTLLAHASELEWAAGFGVNEHLIRLSVGVESREELEKRIDVALEAAGRAASEACRCVCL